MDIRDKVEDLSFLPKKGVIVVVLNSFRVLENLALKSTENY